LGFWMGISVSIFNQVQYLFIFLPNAIGCSPICCKDIPFTKLPIH